MLYYKYCIRTTTVLPNAGGIILKIRHLAASFGRLDHQTLDLEDGLNILQAPNETGKSTWCAFLAAMFYGVNSRERDRAGFIADKNRYAPWSGSPMRGRLDCQASGRELTLLRDTRRAGAPMASFKAVYTGTDDEVPGLTGTACGETLLGVPREVFERSAFIRQAGLGVTADKELERRIAALITSGDEEISYTEAAAALKKQLNRRQSNQRTGQIPAAQTELAEVRRQIDELERQRQELDGLRRQEESLQSQEASLKEKLEQWQRYHAGERRRQLEELRRDAEQAEQSAAALREQLKADHVPENDAIARLRGAIVNLETTRKSVLKARDTRDEALKQRLRAESAVNESPFAGQTPESARKASSELPKNVRRNIWPGLLTVIFGFSASFAAFWAVLTYTNNQLFSAILLAALLLAFAGIAVVLRKRAVRAAQNAALRKRFGTADPAEIAALADTYCQLYAAQEAAQADAARKSAAADALYATLNSNEQAILLEVRRFAPAAFDIPTADRLLREAAVRRKALADAEARARAAALRCELLTRQEAFPQDAGGDAPPEESEEELTAALESLTSRRSALRSQADRLTGQIAATGDPAALSARAEELEARVRALTGEYDALALALEALDSANTAIQNRFSPALGRRAAEIFSQLTGGRYTGVTLDRSFHLSAEPTGDPVSRDAQLLSAGAADQLYLAVRLAICQLVLPPEKNLPIILDDALASFDDTRCAAALRWLREEAEHRQILLFTCHSREAEFFRQDPAVKIQVLTAPGQQV